MDIVICGLLSKGVGGNLSSQPISKSSLSSPKEESVVLNVHSEIIIIINLHYYMFVKYKKEEVEDGRRSLACVWYVVDGAQQIFQVFTQMTKVLHLFCY